MMLHLPSAPLAVVPILVGPLQALLSLLPYILLGLAGLFGSIFMAIFRPWKIVRFVWTQKVALLVLAAAGVGVWFLFSHVLVSTAQVAAVDKGVDWALWRGGLDRRAFVPGAADPTKGGIVWNLAEGGLKTFLSSPAVVGNRVYAVSAVKGPIKDQSYIYSLDADTGKVVWKFAPKNYRATFSSPAVSGKYLAIGEGTHWTRDARIVCLDVEASEKQRKGVELWEYRAHWHVESSPCIAEGKVCVGAASDGVYCFAADGDGKGGPKLLWRLDAKDFPDVESSPLIYKGRVYFGQGREGGQAIVCVNAEDGALIWRIKTPYSVFGAPAIADGKLYIGMGVGDFVNDAAKLQAEKRDELKKEGKPQAEIDAAVKALAAAGEVWCVDLKADKPTKPLWTYHFSQTILGAVAVADKKAFFGSLDGNLYCVNADDGKLINKWNGHSPMQASPAVAQDHVYVATQAGQLYGLDKDALTVVWQVDLGAPAMSSPAVARGHVYVGTGDINTERQGLVCVGEPGTAARPVWRGHLGGPGQNGWTRGSVIGERGKYLWRYPQTDSAADESAAVAAVVHAPPAFIGDVCYVGVNEKDRRGLVALELAKAGGAAPKPIWFCPSANGVYLSAAAVEGAVYFVDGRPGDANRKLFGLDSRTGKSSWNLPVASAASGRFFLTGRYLVIADQPGMLSCFALSDDSAHAPTLVWSQPLGEIVDTPFAAENLLVVAAQKPSRLATIDLQTGLILWDKKLDLAPLTGPVVVEDHLWIGHAGGISSFDLAGGQPREDIAGASVSTGLVVDGTRVAAINAQGEILVIDGRGANAAPLRVAGADAGQSPVLHDDLLIYFAGGNIHTRRLPAAPTTEPATKPSAASGQDKVWCAIDAGWLGKPVSPMIVRGSQLYFAADKAGLVCAGMKE